ncbi:MAG: TauD/TfdA dioxygenase family protein, partial [Gammaproteobacteria bacterium]
MTYEFHAEREQPAFRHIKTQPISGAIGGDIDLDITRPLSEEEAEEVRQALNYYHVVFFHDQDLTPAQHVEFAKIFGEVQMGGTIPRLEEQPEVKKQEYT